MNKKLKRILEKDPSTLTDEEKTFLQSNISELSEEDKVKFADAIEEEKDEDDDEEDQDEDKEKGEGIDVDNLKKMINDQVQDSIKSQSKKISDNIMATFMKGVSESRKKALDTGKPQGSKNANDVTRKWMKALLVGDHATCKALTTDPAGTSPDDSDAGLLIPTELRNEVLRLAETQYGLARKDMLYLPFSGPGNSRTIPTLGTSIKVNWVGEKGKAKGTQPKFAIITQTLKKLLATVPFTTEILEDSLIDINGLLAKLFAEAISKEEDYQFFCGDGSPWTGILNNGDVNKVTSSGSALQPDANDLLAMQDKTPSSALANGKYYLNRTVLSSFRGLKDNQGRYILQDPVGNQPPTLWNKPYETSDVFPELSTINTGDPFILFGDLKMGAVLGDKQQITVKLLEEATLTDTDDSTAINLAEQDMIALRLRERVGYVVALAKAMTVLEAGAPHS